MEMDTEFTEDIVKGEKVDNEKKGSQDRAYPIYLN